MLEMLDVPKLYMPMVRVMLTVLVSSPHRRVLQSHIMSVDVQIVLLLLMQLPMFVVSRPPHPDVVQHRPDGFLGRRNGRGGSFVVFFHLGGDFSVDCHGGVRAFHGIVMVDVAIEVIGLRVAIIMAALSLVAPILLMISRMVLFLPWLVLQRVDLELQSSSVVGIVVGMLRLRFRSHFVVMAIQSPLGGGGVVFAFGGKDPGKNGEGGIHDIFD
mmetsp:Transcript_18794/g.39445  ORF Transcript_18794/g.39445 Transcript_18794/m.39445 type:complete len:214 (-) Transcript_18794:385-1026(-)